jgi:hypothetical protein
VQQQLTFPNTGDLAADLKTQITSVIDLSNDPNFGPSFRALSPRLSTTNRWPTS